MSWWDYGYWITYIAQRVPNANPGQRRAADAALFLTAQDESTATEVLDRVGSRYVVIDHRTAVPSIDSEYRLADVFAAVAEWAGKDPSDFFEVYYIQRSGRREPVIYYYPEYYRSVSTRLFAFGGDAVVPNDSTWVISYVERTEPGGRQYKESLEQRQFADHEEAEEYLRVHGSENHRMVGMDPFASPIPLHRLQHYDLVYQSGTREPTVDQSTVSRVQVFRYAPEA